MVEVGVIGKECSINSGFTQSGWNNLKYRKIGKEVNVTGAVITTAQTSWVKVISTLPSGFRPTLEVDTVCRTSWGQVMKVAISSNGEISTLNLNDGNDLPSNEYIFINVTYFVD